MADVRAEALLAAARELEERDERIARELGELAAFEVGASDVRDGTAAIRVFREKLPAERAHLDEALVGAQGDLVRLREALVGAERALANLEAGRRPDEERLAAARRAAAHARDDVEAAEGVLGRVHARLASLASEEERLAAELPRLEEEARGLAAGLRASSRLSHGGGLDPAPGLDGLFEWASRARAAVLVARSALETERERIVREASELAAATLGEELGPVRVALVREWLERGLRG